MQSVCRFEEENLEKEIGGRVGLEWKKRRDAGTSWMLLGLARAALGLSEIENAGLLLT